MPLVEFTDRDLLRGKPIEPAWYRVHLDSIDGEGELSKDKKSTNYNVEGTILFNGDNGDPTYKGYPLTWNFNSKAMGFTKELFIAFGLELKSKERYRLEALAGKDIDVFVENDTYQGRTTNKVNHKYRPIKPEVVEQAPSTTPTEPETT
jgi:hypothetical protein